MTEDDFNIWSDLFGVPDLDYDGDVDEIDDYLEEDLEDYNQKQIKSYIDDDDDDLDLGDFPDDYIPTASDYISARKKRTTENALNNAKTLHTSEARNVISSEHIQKEEDSKDVARKESFAVGVAMLISGLGSLSLALIIWLLYPTDTDLELAILALVCGIFLTLLGILFSCSHYLTYRKPKSLNEPNPPVEESQDKKETETTEREECDINY